MPKPTARYKLLLTYDIQPPVQEAYFQFMLGEFVPTAQTLGLHMNGAWHTAYGNYPMRLVEFIAEDDETIRRAFQDPAWHSLEDRLLEFVENYHRKMLPLREDVFQF